MAENKRIDAPTGTETVGHEWDGIEELDTPLPRWWLWTFYACIVFAIGYMIVYPAWPLLHGATPGTAGWTSRGQLQREEAVRTAELAPIGAAIARTPIDQLPANPALFQQALEGGRAAFRMHCTQCHGAGAAGSPGYPNLNDDDWLWGGDLRAIEFTITNGARNPDHAQTRMSQMPAFGRDGIMTAAEIEDVVAYVRTISRQQAANASARRGAALFAQNCAACHGADGHGNRQVGAPNLTDPIWLYGGDADTLRTTITNARAGVMPAWDVRLDPVTIRMLAVYVHSLGGGESSATVQTAGR
ncbi:cytochrome-c oxidase, cbb3-type subunit III [Allosphingosinicella sp.]|uniref:cytochrome-c oxidase, cbb3-type subunit III n=1 Tax=Allosphingosinicella sp. TaxID=2823234 RepID=UPI00378456A1